MTLADVFSWVCLLSGSFFVVVSGLAVLRLPDYYSRIHGAAMSDTLGAALILLGLIGQAGLSLVAVKLGLVFLFMALTGPTAAHALAKTAYTLGLTPRLAEEEPDHRNAD